MGPNYDFNAMRPDLPAAATMDRQSRAVFRRHYVRLDTYPNGPVDPTYLGAVREPAIDYIYLNPKIDELSMGYQTAPPVLHDQTEQEAFCAPDLGNQYNVMVKKIRVVDEDWVRSSGFIDAENFWDQIDDEVSALYLNCYMYPNLQRARVTLLGLYEAFLPAGMPNNFAIRYYTDDDAVYIAEMEEDESEKKYRYTDTPNRRRPRNLVVRIDINHDASNDREEHRELEWTAILTKEEIESEDAWLGNPEFHRRLVWEMARMTLEERLWKRRILPTPTIVGNLQLLSTPTTN
ncbi:uncharacterized protein ColSpa_11406 [Colletotrichum spaethianum]|uniref:Uncharacterized protein n=1 Tax=Colletotrichum spaethianum TaxID=700344 RepID=A0AA37UPQ2_9PEZI|nr:uncharacterized protein ColSpa_11406 [Colletotrichum spaethianum]GKT51225.1 hypothetical protein ColSpa_11406 [Colletotrichum spaethianum]